MNNSAPRKKQYSNRWITVLIVGFIFFSPAFLQGCDGLTGVDPHDETAFDDRIDIKAPEQENKLRHPTLLDSAKRHKTGISGKSSTVVASLFLAFNEYEADGITPRLLNKYEVTNRILEEYGITRRILDKYGITHRILNQYGITRRILNQYDVTRRILEKYGITPRILSRYNDQVSSALLNENNVTDAILVREGLTQSDIDDFNRLSALLTEYNLTIEEFCLELETAIQTIRMKVYIDGAHLGISIELESDLLDIFLQEISDDSDILFAEPDVTIDTSELGTTSGAWYDKQIIPWGITQIETPIPGMLSIYWQDYISKNPVHVYVLDSGALASSWWDDLNYIEKKDFTMLFENPDQLLWEENNAPETSGFDPGDTGNPYDESGHGTHIAGTIGANNDLIGVVGVAPSVKLHSLKVLTKEGRTDITTLLAAVDYVTRAKIANPEWPIVVNLSLGVDIGTNAYNVLDEAIQTSIDAGVVYVAAAGNDGRNASTYSPAHVDDVITVGAIDEKNFFAGFSNYGETVDILAPGENIISLSHIIEDTKAFESILASGTSYATPHVTGAVVRYLGRNPNASAKEVVQALLDAAHNEVSDVPSGTTNKILNVGSLLNVQGDSPDQTKEVSDAVAVEVKSSNVRDEFTYPSFEGNNGNTDWTGAWQEIGESNGEENGKIRIVESNKCADGNCLRIESKGEGKGIFRPVNLNGTSAATLSFDYFRRNLTNSNVQVEVSADGGNSWAQVFNIKRGDDSTQRHISLDISPYASSDTQIRFYVDGSGENKVFIDNIEVSY